MAFDISLALLAFTSALLSVLTLKATDTHENWWFRKSFLSKLLVLNSLLVLFVCIPKIYVDNKEKQENRARISNLHVKLDKSADEQLLLQKQLSKAKEELSVAINYGARLEIEYQQKKDLMLSKKWQRAFLAEKSANQRLLHYLANELENTSSFYFLNNPTFLRNNYLKSVMSSSYVHSAYQLELLTELHDQINDINERIKAGSEAVLPGVIPTQHPVLPNLLA
ncbi:hypothetical protein [Vibrio parahaemolyticus]|uniref:hypothetical protein n=1 Tax=Vibrio parahaemolyticus TaxID=670 RepID=UPI000AA59A6E|nr:hypothetical protein [Vibrio parahaemolyticus]EHR1202251.1 hypothetical protein [Vibrio parahaemolyticus]EHR5855614.1 hypothetical protein [Vibrio parahaemolyticus]